MTKDEGPMTKSIDPDFILSVLDQCCDDYTFPMLDNGYRYLAATRLSLFRSAVDWAVVIEVFGYSVRAGLPDTHICTFASRLHKRDAVSDYVNPEAHQQYLLAHPHNEARFIHPIQQGTWQATDDSTYISATAKQVTVRQKHVRIPKLEEYAQYEIELEEAPQVQVFELCRYLAVVERDLVLATPDEQRASILPNMTKLLQLEEWNHPNVVDEEERPSGSNTFQQLATVLATGAVKHYRPKETANTPWRHWPEGGRL
jgi:hypothetical protein